MFIQNKALSFMLTAFVIASFTGLQGCSSNYSRTAEINKSKNTNTTKTVATGKQYKYNMDPTMLAHLDNHSHKGMMRCHNHLQSMGKRMYHCHYHTQDR